MRLCVEFALSVHPARIGGHPTASDKDKYPHVRIVFIGNQSGRRGTPNSRLVALDRAVKQGRIRGTTN